MTAREEARIASLDADPEYVRLRDVYVARLDAFDQARRDLDEASILLAMHGATILARRP